VEQGSIETGIDSTPARTPRRRWPRRVALAVLALVAAGLALVYSGLGSRASAGLLARYVGGISFALDSGAAPSPAPGGVGPLDVRLGYTALPDIITRLQERGFRIEAQANVSDRFRRVAGLGLFPPFHEPTQAGLTLLGRNGAVISRSRFPGSIYTSFDDVPAPVRQTLLYLENRELLDNRFPFRNPAIEWDRFVAALANFAGAKVLGGGGRFGASTLATQLEKLRHSLDGVTRTPADKARQMASATLRAYLDGPLTTDVRRRILLDYLNALPVGAVAGYGEVIGMREGLRLWFGLDPDSADRRLRTAIVAPADAGQEFRAVMMLLLAQRRPSYYLNTEAGRKTLVETTDSHLRLMEADSVVSAALARAALASRLTVRTEPPPPVRMAFVERKAINASRTHLAELVAAPSQYQLDRYDLTARTTIDSAGQVAATRLIRRLADRAFVDSVGLSGERLLGQQDPARVAYSFVLYERTPQGNALRVQVDNLDRPFDLNLGARLELGSTAKLRTLVTYLDIVARLHAELADTTTADSAPARRAGDPITRWTREYLGSHPDATADSVLAAAMQRRYSASPSETFFTGGGTHAFGNFDRTYDNDVPTVLEGFRHSINLVFVRLMRDVVRYHEARVPGYDPGILDDPAHPGRRAVLERFADREGRAGIDRAARRHRGLAPDSSLTLLLSGRATPPRHARLLRALDPGMPEDSLQAAVATRFPGQSLTPDELRAVTRTIPASASLEDRAYVTGTDPLELWVVSRLRANPARTAGELQAEGAEARQGASAWLFRNTPSVRRAQDRSIRIMLERDAFQGILTAWRTVGYPYNDIVTSLGSSIGSSGDRPGALSELVGILVGDGIRRPAVRLEELHFAAGTPFEVRLRRDTLPGHRVLSPAVAAVARAALDDVVSAGTATAVRDALPGSGLTIGGKTGTGQNQSRTFGPGGRLVASRTTSRTATFVFHLGDRFYGSATAYVDGAEAERYAFTSGLPVRVVRLLLPQLASLLAPPEAAVTGGS
jgi:membrane peptidoglycan carboxypeptidase